MAELDVSLIEFDPVKVGIFLTDLDLSQAELNKQLGFNSPNVVNKIIKGKREATASDLLKISTALNKNPSDFCKD